MSWIVSTKQYIPAVIGESFGGGYFAGYISHTADGNPTHALIVAPRATGASGTGYTLTTNYAWKTTNTNTPGTESAYDGRANTDAMITAGIASHPAANFCVGLSINGYSDWYLPALKELHIAYFNLKPSTIANSTGFAGNVGTDNIYQVPKRTINYGAGYPNQTPLVLFQTGGSEAFSTDIHKVSTIDTTNTIGSFYMSMNTGAQSSNLSAQTHLVRAFRRIAL